MPHVSTFVYAEGLQMEHVPQAIGGQRLHVISPMNYIVPQFVPCLFSFAVVFGIIDTDTTKSHVVRYKFFSPKHEQIIDTNDVPLPPMLDNADLPVDMRGVMMNFDFRNVPFRYEGEYYSEVILDGTSLGKFPIKVKGKESL